MVEIDEATRYAGDIRWIVAVVQFVDEAPATAGRGWLARQGVQFHWTRDAAEPAADLTTFLASLQRDKRKIYSRVAVVYCKRRVC